MRGYTDMEIIGATRDDAAGECFDKTARVLGLPYPGGKPIDELSQTGDDTRYVFPIAHVDGNPYDMSFSGLKTAVINLVHNAEQKGEEIDRASLAASFTKAVSDSLVPRTVRAAKELGYKKVVVAGARRRRTGSSFLSRRSNSAATTEPWSARRGIMSTSPGTSRAATSTPMRRWSFKAADLT